MSEFVANPLVQLLTGAGFIGLSAWMILENKSMRENHEKELKDLNKHLIAIVVENTTAFTKNTEVMNNVEEAIKELCTEIRRG